MRSSVRHLIFHEKKPTPRIVKMLGDLCIPGNLGRSVAGPREEAIVQYT